MEKHNRFFPDQISRYYEPFLGGGSVFFKLRPQKATLSDVNAELIEVYESIRDEPEAVLAGLEKLGLKHSPEHFYEVRRKVPSTKIARTVRFLYLNRTCWNGLYRVNKLGEFNVPIGTKTSVLLPTDDFFSVSRALARVSLRQCDFAASISHSREGDFVYCDPPYTVQHNNNGFLKYNEQIFSWRDQVRLAKTLRAASARGVRFAVSNAEHESISNLYKGFKMRVLNRASIISGSNSGRGRYSEMLVTNF